MELPLRPNTKVTRFAYLDGLRGWAALLVVFHHGTLALDFALYTGLQRDSRAPWDIWLSGTPFVVFATGGNLAVCIFFALSGFVLAHAYSSSRQTWPALAVRRYLRLGLPMLAACLFSWMLLASGMMRSGPAALITHSHWLAWQFHQRPDLMAAATEPLTNLLEFSLSNTSYDTSLWTMPIEACASLILLTVFVALRRTTRDTDQLAGLLFASLAVLWIGSYLSLFGFGAALRLIPPKRLLTAIRARNRRLVLTIVAGLFFGTVPFSAARWRIYDWMTAPVSHIAWHTRPWSHEPESFWHGVGAALILLAVASSSQVQSALSRPVGRFLGRISFPLYLLHVPLLMVVECQCIISFRDMGFRPLISGIASLMIFVIVAVAVAALMTPIVEGGAIALSARVGRAVDGRIRSIVSHLARSRRKASTAAIRDQSS